MDLHKLIQRQIKKYLPVDYASDERIQSFIEAVNDSYLAFEKDKELSEHAFKISEQEFESINQKLKNEMKLKTISVLKLKEAIKTISSSGHEIEQTDDDLLGVLNILTVEIAKRKEAEAAMLKAKEEAEKANFAKSEFLSVMSHEIRTPLHAVVGMGHLLLQNNPRQDQLENLKALKISADNLQVLINDILDFSKIEAGKLDIDTAEFDLSKLVNEIIIANANNANEKQNKIIFQYPGSQPTLFIGDSLRIGQVLNNLVSNAVKFTNNGTIRIDIKVGEIKNGASNISISVSDTGVGIANDKLNSIFESFSQASSSITRNFGGTGLGLTITKKLLSLMGSEIFVDSRLGLGSRFYFDLLLPVVQNEVTQKENNPDKNLDLKNVKILLVEDTAFNVLFATQLLKNWEASVDVADNGEIAVNKLKEQDYDLVLMDLQMPVMDGYTAAVEIRKFNTAIPIIALTASATSNVKEKVLEAGMQDYITKPFNPEEFLKRLQKYINSNK